VHTTFAIGVFKHQRSEWNQVITKAEKEKKLFKDILGKTIRLLFKERYTLIDTNL
jgi:hypothetical protein